MNKIAQEEILDSLGEGVFTVDKNFKITFINKAAERVTGYSRSEVVGKFCKNIFRSELCSLDCPIARVLQSNKNLYDHESKIVRKDGVKTPIKLNAAVLFNENNEPGGGVISFRELGSLEKLRSLIEKQSTFFSMAGISKPMQEIFELIKEISNSNASVFIRGESGTGKELVAEAIQQTSSRKNFPFVKVNCSVFPPNLLASELFGHVKGAFTDAVKDRPGRFEIADKGTLFLDEVAEMPLQMQPQLLRVLQEGTFERVGESRTREADVRIIAATNINIHTYLSKGLFSDDLFYRLNVIPIEVPPLRKRKEDIPALIRHFLNKFSILYKKEIYEVQDIGIDALMNYNWPGNIRELENVLEYAFVRTHNSNIITLPKLPSNIRGDNKVIVSVGKAVFSGDKEKYDLVAALEKWKWNKSKAAEELGIGRTTLWRKMKIFGLDDE